MKRFSWLISLVTVCMLLTACGGGSKSSSTSSSKPASTGKIGGKLVIDNVYGGTWPCQFNPFISADEVQIYIMVYIAFLGAAVASWRRLHLRMDVLVHRLPQRLQTVLSVIELGLIIVLAALVLYVSSGYVKQMAGLDARSQNAGIPMWIPHSAIVLGFGLIALLAVLQFVQSFRKGDGP